MNLLTKIEKYWRRFKDALNRDDTLEAEEVSDDAILDAETLSEHSFRSALRESSSRSRFKSTRDLPSDLKD